MFSIPKTVTGIAQEVTGNIQDFRKIIDFNPNLLPFKLPPQVDLGVNTINQLTGVKIPTSEEVLENITGDLKKGLRGLIRPTLTGDDLVNALKSGREGEDVVYVPYQIDDTLEQVETQVSDLLNSIEWLY